MIDTGKDILIRFKKRWQLLQGLEIFLYALGPAVALYLVTSQFLAALSCFLVLLLIFAIVFKPWQLSLEKITRFIDQKLETMQYSTGLLLASNDKLTPLAQLQRQRVSNQLQENISSIQPKHNLFRAAGIASVFVLAGFLLAHWDVFKPSVKPTIAPQNAIVFKPTDSAAIKSKPPVLTQQRVTISYPSYTKIPAFSTSKMDIKALEGSRLSWHIEFDGAVQEVIWERDGKSYPMPFHANSYQKSITLTAPGFYDFKFSDSLGAVYLSDLYALEVIKDQEPVITMQNLKPFISFDFDETKILKFNTLITDDFGIAEAYIIATVSKGTGESVKFREEKFNFDTSYSSGSKNLSLAKKIDLDALKMEPGDELYFYVEALDGKQPKPNRSRSETYFAVIKDTTSYEFEVEGTMGVDLMPDYFRSQRQLIIDTEKLISEKSSLSKEEFKSKSNALGYDQKQLRLKYGEFAGEETEGAEEHEAETEAEHSDEDPLAEYRHAHDGNNEHNLVADADAKEAEPEEQDPKTKSFTQSLKTKMRLALNEMWDAELQLRLYEPKKSLPYQYRALELLQQIKNSARIYVHRIGFDPPPIKEDKRLSGKMDKVVSFRKSQEFEDNEAYPYLRQTIQRLSQLRAAGALFSEEDRVLFEKAGTELATLAIENPGKYLSTLQGLKRLAEDKEQTTELLEKVQGGLLLALPKSEANPSKGTYFSDVLNEWLLKELELHE